MSLIFHSFVCVCVCVRVRFCGCLCLLNLTLKQEEGGTVYLNVTVKEERKGLTKCSPVELCEVHR